MNYWPLKFRELGHQYLFTDDAGGFFVSDGEFLDRTVHDSLTSNDEQFLLEHGHAYGQESDLEFTSFAARWSRRIHVPSELSYVILVPTLRCDLACNYCQVSRVHERAKGFDWTEDHLALVLDWLGTLTSPSIKVEFQGGEPLLRLDILQRVRSFCRQKFESSQFVVCTNLQNVSEGAWDFLSENDTLISTSYDGTLAAHQAQRTKSDASTRSFEANITYAMEKFGPSKVSALPTIDPQNAPDPVALIESYTKLGIRSIYLRRVNYQGFARKKYDFKTSTAAWQEYYREFIEAIVEYNLTAQIPVQEYYLSHLLKRILQGGHNGHVDLRSPSWLAKDYLLIDYDGKFYPTDEARMVTRIGQVDLSVGSLSEGLDQAKIDVLNGASINQLDPDCMHCTFQQYCGLDIVDDLSRYGRIDMPRHLTAHCQNHLFLFDLAFELLYSDAEPVRMSIQRWMGLGSLPGSLIARHA